MYRIFCESYENFIESMDGDNYRLQISKPFELLVDIDKYNKEQNEQSELYKKLSDIMEFMKNNVKRFPKLKAFLDVILDSVLENQKYKSTKIWCVKRRRS